MGKRGGLALPRARAQRRFRSVAIPSSVTKVRPSAPGLPEGTLLPEPEVGPAHPSEGGSGSLEGGPQHRDEGPHQA